MAASQPDNRYWVNTEPPKPPQQAPRNQTGVLGWLHANLFSSIGNTILTIVSAAGIYYVVTRLYYWVVNVAYWEPIWVNRKLFAVYLYPWERIWQPCLVLLIVSVLFGLSAGKWGGFMQTIAIGVASLQFALALLPLETAIRLVFAGGGLLVIAGYLFARGVKFPDKWLIFAWIASLPISIWILRGAVTIPFFGTVWVFGGEVRIPFSLMGGLLLTILLTVVGIALSFPIGVLLALGRRSSLPVIKGLSVTYIEVIRGVPFVALLFMALIALPLALPAGATAPENAVRAMVAIIAFESAYLAENVRGGLQSVPKGQYEASDALGLGTFGKLRLIIMPQALRAVIPALVGQFISLFKDTSLVSLVGLVELLGVAQVVIKQPEWVEIQGGISREVYLFVAVVYFIFSFGMSYASKRLEVQLGVGKR
jgi:general L-amino acid transport system permease protein